MTGVPREIELLLAESYSLSLIISIAEQRHGSFSEMTLVDERTRCRQGKISSNEQKLD